MIRTDLRNFYDNDENINHSLISLNVFTETFTGGIHSLKIQIENSLELEIIRNAWTSFKKSLDKIDTKIHSYSSDMRKDAPEISHLLHTFEALQKERNQIKNKNVRVQPSAEYERRIASLNDMIKELSQSYSIRIKSYNDKIDELQELIKYLNRTDGSSQSSTSNQLILDWNDVLDHFEHLIGFIKNDLEIVNNMRQALFTFVSSMQNIQLIKLSELEDVEIQAINNNILIENLQKQVSDLTAKNSELLNSVETLRKNLDEQQTINLTNNKEEELRNENDKLKRQLNTLEAKNKELSENYDAYVKKHVEFQERTIKKDSHLKDMAWQIENYKEKIDNLTLEHRRELDLLTKEKEKLINENKELKKLHDEDNKANAELHEQLDEQRKTINSLNLERDKLDQQLRNDFREREQKMLNDLHDLREQLSAAELQLTQKQDHNKSLMLESQKLQEKNNIQKEQIKSFREQLVRKDVSISDLKNQVKILKQQSLALETEKQSGNQREIELKQKYEEEKSKNESLKIQIRGLKNQLLSVQAGPSAEPSTKVSDESYSKAHLKRKLRSDEDTTKRAKPLDVDHWQNEKKKLDFTDAYVTSSIDSIDEDDWNVLEKQIKKLNQKLNELHDKLTATYKRFEAAQKLRNKDTKIIPFSNEMKDIIEKIRQKLELNRSTYSEALEKLIVEINTNYEKDIELHKNSQSVYINLTNSIKKDYSKKENIYKERIRRLIAKGENLENANEKWKKTEAKTNTALKDLQEQITQFMERFNERNEKRKKLLFSIQSHLVNNIYSKVVNELLISIDKLID